MNNKRLLNKKCTLLLLVALIVTAMPVQASLSDSVKSILARMQNNAIARQITARRVGYLVLGAGAVATTAGLWWWLKNRAVASSSPTAVSDELPVIPLQKTQFPMQNPLPVQNQLPDNPASGSSPRTPTASSSPTAVSGGQNPISTLSPAATSLNGPGRRDVEGEKEQAVHHSSVEGVSRAHNSFVECAMAYRRGDRQKMEDTVTFSENDDYSFGAVFDGHGGPFVAEILSRGQDAAGISSLGEYIFSNLASGHTPEQAITDAFYHMDNQLREKVTEALYSGSTAVGTLINLKEKKVYLFGAGDSRVIHIDSSGEVAHASDDHKPEKEEERIGKAGGRVRWGKINDMLAVSRAFGDFVMFKQHGNKSDEEKNLVIVRPDIKSFVVQGDSKEYLVLASDGVWDKLSNKKVAGMVTSKELKQLTDRSAGSAAEAETKWSFGSDKRLKQVAEHIRDMAFNRYSTDNITAMVISLGGSQQEGGS